MRFVLVFFCLLFLTACTVFSPTQKSEFISIHQGRVALTITDLHTNKRVSNNVLFFWQERLGGYRLTLKSLIGTTLLEIDQYSDHAVITVDSARQYRPDDAEVFLAKMVNMPIPIQYLSRIFRGRTKVATEHVYQGWHMKVTRFNQNLPTRFSLEREQGSQHILIKVVVSS